MSKESTEFVGHLAWKMHSRAIAKLFANDLDSRLAVEAQATELRQEVWLMWPISIVCWIISSKTGLFNNVSEALRNAEVIKTRKGEKALIKLHGHLSKQEYVLTATTAKRGRKEIANKPNGYKFKM